MPPKKNEFVLMSRILSWMQEDVVFRAVCASRKARDMEILTEFWQCVPQGKVELGAERSQASRLRFVVGTSIFPRLAQSSLVSHLCHV